MSAAILDMLPKGRGRPGRPRVQHADGRRALDMYPTNYRGRVFIYAIAFDGDVIKIGRTTNPRQRLTDHWKRGNGEVKWVHVFESVNPSAGDQVERRVLADFAAVAQQINGTEWHFSDFSKEKVLGIVRAAITRCKDHNRALWAKEAAREVKRRELLDALAQGGVAEMLKGRPFTQHPEKPD